ncbi:unnamed protein product, partial [Mesorhabditis spiculigera]
MPSSYYEKGEYFVSEKEVVNGTVTRDYEDSEEWSRGRRPPHNAITDFAYDRGGSTRSTLPPPSYRSPGLMRRGDTGIRDNDRWVDSRPRSRDVYQEEDPRDPWSSRFAEVVPPPRARSYSRSSNYPEPRQFEELRRSRSTDKYREPMDYPSSRDYSFTRDAPYYSVQSKDRLSDHGSRHELRQVSNEVASRPGSPGPVAGAGDIVNTAHGFTISLDVKHFQPQDIRRKYSMPSDIRLDSVVSHLTDNGYLVITGSRKGWKETQITMHTAGRPPRGSSVISNV